MISPNTALEMHLICGDPSGLHHLHWREAEDVWFESGLDVTTAKCMVSTNCGTRENRRPIFVASDAAQESYGLVINANGKAT
jgi:hypothetical protein